MLKKILLLTLFIAFLNARVVVDINGKEITLPDKIERATPMGSVSMGISIVLGNADKIITGAYSGLSSFTLKVFPSIKMTGFRGGSPNANIETIIASKSQVVFGPAGAFLDALVEDKLEEAGIAVVRMSVDLSNMSELKDRIIKTAEIFGDESIERAKQLNAHTDENVAFVQKRLPKNIQKKRVLVIYDRAGIWATTGLNFISIADECIKLAGGINVVPQKMGPFGSLPSVNDEQIIVYNPDIIITNTQDSLQTILKRETFKYINAVKNKQVFVQPRGIGGFWIEGGLQVLWLAKTLYPELFADLDMRAKVREFYTKFYNYNLSEDELTEILNPKEKPRVVY